MKKKPKICFIITFLGVLFMITSGCHREKGTNVTPSASNTLMNVNAAETYYYTTLIKKPGGNLSVTSPNTGSIISNSAKSGSPNQKYLIFSKAYSSQNDLETFTEVPIKYNQRSSMYISKNSGAGALSNFPVLNASFDRLIIYKYKKTGLITECIVTFIPDSAYLANHHNDISHNHIDKLDADYNGYLYYKNGMEPPHIF